MKTLLYVIKILSVIFVFYNVMKLGEGRFKNNGFEDDLQDDLVDAPENDRETNTPSNVIYSIQVGRHKDHQGKSMNERFRK